MIDKERLCQGCWVDDMLLKIIHGLDKYCQSNLMSVVKILIK